MAELLSACLMGVPCRYDGRGKPVALGSGPFVPVCPELLAGFGVPRPAIERSGDRVVVVDTREDVTDPLATACDTIVERAVSLSITSALLKQNSPSCGSTHIYMDGRLVPGVGLLTEKLEAAGIEVRGE